MNKIDKMLLEKVSSLHDIKLGAFNIRKNGEVVERKSKKALILLLSRMSKIRRCIFL